MCSFFLVDYRQECGTYSTDISVFTIFLINITEKSIVYNTETAIEKLKPIYSENLMLVSNTLTVIVSDLQFTNRTFTSSYMPRSVSGESSWHDITNTSATTTTMSDRPVCGGRVA